MTPMPTIRSMVQPVGLASLTIALALILAACQAGTGASSSPSESAAESMAMSMAPESMAESMSPEESAAAATDLGVSEAEGIGEFVTDAEGRTLYIFTNDSDGVSNCSDECAANWPPFTVDGGAEPMAAEGITGTLGTIERDDGSTQVTLEGLPLYYFAADSAPGDTNGEGQGDVWFVARPDGSTPDEAAIENPGDY